MPKISVIVPTYNNAQYLPEAIDSIISQTFDDIEIIVVDDGSTDNTKHIVSSFGRRLKYHFQTNQGLAVARNTGIQNSSAPFFTFLDGDDKWCKDNLKYKIEILENDRSVGAVFSDFTLFNSNGILADSGISIQYPIFYRRGRTLDKIFESKTNFPINGANDFSLYQGNIFNSLLFGNFINACSIIIRREFQKKIGYFKPDLRTQQDYEYWLRFSQLFNFAYIDLPLVFYRRHSTQLTAHKNMPRIIDTVINILLPYLSQIEKSTNPKLRRAFSQRIGESYRELGLAYLGNKQNRLARTAFCNSDIFSKNRPFTKILWMLSFMPPLISYDFLNFLRSIRFRLNNSVKNI